MEEQVDWVKARAECSIGHVFDRLKDEVEEDVKTRNSQQSHSHFTVKHHRAGSFTVIEGEGGAGRAVVFNLSENTIEVKTGERDVFLKATITLNDEGQCMLKSESQEVYSWQFRRRALEKLFFD